MPLHLTPDQLQTIIDESTTQYPQECCGLILGKIDNTNRITHQIWPTQNSWTIASELDFLDEADQPSSPHSPRDRFAIDPRELLKAQRSARDRNLTIIGIYHSHPDHPAVPSERDRQQAWSGYSYLILSVHQGQVVDRRSWQLDDRDPPQFQSEPIVIGPSPIITLPLPNDR
jgi:proteasome lid subunit RPN8/RPN11